jgi:DNA-binding MarR family transcriptional regulator/N-acetylglutamate synthase-like GNAT family acetyltransferase
MDIEERIYAVRAFNRFYTRRIGVLREGLAGTAFPLTEARVLYELAHRANSTAAQLGRDLGIDAGYLSRILRAFETRGLLHRARSKTDGRQSHLSLTAAGRKAFVPLNTRSHEDVRGMLDGLSDAEQERLVDAMQTVERLLDAPRGRRPPYVLRSPEPGDLGAIVQLHGALYAREYHWDERFEALVAGIVARFVERFDARRERCWIAEVDGEVVGSVLLVRRSATVGQLRLLIVHPKARGLGIGERLVAECIRFARHAGYRTLRLWTNSVLVAARHIYEKAGFRMVHKERHTSFGHDLVGETWELAL